MFPQTQARYSATLPGQKWLEVVQDNNLCRSWVIHFRLVLERGDPCVRISTCVYISIYTYIHMYICNCIYVFMYVYICMYIYIYAYYCIHMCLCISMSSLSFIILTYMYIHLHTVYIHMSMNTSQFIQELSKNDCTSLNVVHDQGSQGPSQG